MSDELKIAVLSLLLDEANQKPLPQVMQGVASEWLAERDTTPVDAEWLDGVMGRGQIGPDGKYTEWSTDDGTCEVTLWRDGPPVMSHKLHNIKIKPTRGDVLTALRLFGEKRK